MPHQVGQEFHRNRESKIPESRTALKQTQSNLDDLCSKLRQLRIPPHDPVLEVERAEAVRIEAQLSLDTLSEMLRNARDKTPIMPADDVLCDSILTQLNELYDGRVGLPFTANEQARSLIEAKGRYEQKIPPGFEDIKSATYPSRLSTRSGYCRAPHRWRRCSALSAWFYPDWMCGRSPCHGCTTISRTTGP